VSRIELKRGVVLVGQYRLDGLLGKGGMGEVWRGQDLRLKRTVAVKFMLAGLDEEPGFVDGFEREMENVAKLKHENICRVYTGGVIPDADSVLFYMVMELVEGLPLSHKLRLDPRFDEVSACYTAYQIIEALQAAHEQHIIHRDIKPENVIIGKNGHATVLDFGIAKRRGATRDTGRAARGRPRTTRPIGTPRYMSPEQIRGGEIDHRSDLYSTGVVLYRMLAGEFPFPGLDDEDETAILRAHLEDPPYPLSMARPEVSPGLEAMVMRLLAKDPDDRYPDAGTAADELDAYIRGSIPPAHPLAERLAAERKSIAREAVYRRTRTTTAGPPPNEESPRRAAGQRALPSPPSAERTEVEPSRPAVPPPALVGTVPVQPAMAPKDPTSPWVLAARARGEEKTAPLPVVIAPPRPAAPRVSSSASGRSWEKKRPLVRPPLGRAVRQLVVTMSLGSFVGAAAGGVFLAVRAAVRRSSAVQVVAASATAAPDLTAAPAPAATPSATATTSTTAAPSATAASTATAAPNVTAAPRPPTVARPRAPSPTKPAETARPVETAKPAEAAKPAPTAPHRVFGSEDDEPAANVKPAETPKPPPPGTSTRPEP
jgi:eukaryotic-like serine/threonine-protein kinase